jgi:hypothetical protein
MNLTCMYDHTPFTLSRDEKIAALRKMHAENLSHYDARCPMCGRANPVSLDALERSTPGWEEAIRTPMAMPSAPTPAMPTSSMLAPVVKPAATLPAKPAPKRAPTTRRKHASAAKKAARKTKPAAKKVARKATKAKAKPKKTAKKTAKRSSKARSRKR